MRNRKGEVRLRVDAKSEIVIEPTPVPIILTLEIIARLLFFRRPHGNHFRPRIDRDQNMIYIETLLSGIELPQGNQSYSALPIG
jgi:hypothetical protein